MMMKWEMKSNKKEMSKRLKKKSNLENSFIKLSNNNPMIMVANTELHDLLNISPDCKASEIKIIIIIIIIIIL